MSVRDRIRVRIMIIVRVTLTLTLTLKQLFCEAVTCTSRPAPKFFNPESLGRKNDPGIAIPIHN